MKAKQASKLKLLEFEIESLRDENWDLKNKDYSATYAGFFILGAFLAGLTFCVVDSLMYEGKSFTFSEPTVIDICINLSGNENARPVWNGDGTLECEIPSFDHTTNIIIRPAGQELP